MPEVETPRSGLPNDIGLPPLTMMRKKNWFLRLAAISAIRISIDMKPRLGLLAWTLRGRPRASRKEMKTMTRPQPERMDQMRPLMGRILNPSGRQPSKLLWMHTIK